MMHESIMMMMDRMVGICKVHGKLSDQKSWQLSDKAGYRSHCMDEYLVAVARRN
jgi:hypothetical protein